MSEKKVNKKKFVRYKEGAELYSMCQSKFEDQDRFFGSLIVDIYTGFDNVVFEPITKFVEQDKLAAAHNIALQNAGFLTLPVRNV